MEIYIDESGLFTVGPTESISAVGALVVTESQIAEFHRRFAQLKPLLPTERGEVKGKLLAESDVSRVVEFARRSGLLYEITMVELGGDEAVIEAHRRGQCEGLTRSLTPKHHPNVIAVAHSLRERLEQLPLQLYAQSVAMLDLAWRTVCHATAYYCQRDPETLGRFRWVIDAKDKTSVTDWESWWSTVVKPLLQSRSIDEPFPMLEGGDYSHFKAKEIAIPDYLTRHHPTLQGETGLDMSLFGDMDFSSSVLPGLEAVDVLTNAVRRALSGRLGPQGWQKISGLMIHRKAPTYVELLGFGRAGESVLPTKAAVLRLLGNGGRSMLTAKFREE